MPTNINRLADIIMSHNVKIPDNNPVDMEGSWEVFQNVLSTNAYNINGNEEILNHFAELAVIDFMIEATEQGYSAHEIKVFLQGIKNGF